MFSKVNETTYLEYTYISGRYQSGEGINLIPNVITRQIFLFQKVVNKQLIPSLIKWGDLCN